MKADRRQKGGAVGGEGVWGVVNVLLLAFKLQPNHQLSTISQKTEAKEIDIEIKEGDRSRDERGR